MGTTLERIQQIVLEQTRHLGPVGNLHGVAEVANISEGEAKSQQWSVAQVSMTHSPSLTEVAEAYSFERPGLESVDADRVGLVQYPASGAIPAGKALLVYTTIRLDAPRSVPIRVSGEGMQIDVYVDLVRVRSGHETVSMEMSVGTGLHSLVLVLYGGTTGVQIQTPFDVECLRGDVLPSPPTWAGTPVLFNLDPEKGASLGRLEWRNDAFASAWNVYRADTALLGGIDSVEDLGDGDVTVRLSGTQDITAGENAYTRYWPAGVVQEVTLGTDGEGEYTLVRIERSLEAEADADAWVGLEYLQPGSFESMAHLSHAGNSVLRWEDSRVKAKAVYLYKLTALGLFGQTESDFSGTEILYTDDDLPPQGVDWNAVYPPKVTIDGELITVQFCAPPEPDFRGVHVYGPYAFADPEDPTISRPFAFTPDLLVDTTFCAPGSESSPTYNAQLSFSVSRDEDDVPLDGSYFLATFDATGNEQPSVDTVDEATEETLLGAYGLLFDGPGVPKYAGIGFEFDVLEDPDDPERIHTLVLKLYPKRATLAGWVNGDPADGTSAPLLSIYDDTHTDYNEYRITLTREDSETTRFIASATASGLAPQSFEYIMDPDNVPGVSGVHVEDRKARPVVYAIMDDDSKVLRLVKSPFAIPGDILFTASQDAGTDTSTVDYATAMLKYTHTEDLEADEVLEVRIDASRDGEDWNEDVWHGTLQGPGVSAAGIQIAVSVDRTGTYEKHNLTITVSPVDAIVKAGPASSQGTATLTDASGAPQEVSLTAAGSGVWTYQLIRNVHYSQIFVITAETSGIKQSAHYLVDDDGIPGAWVDKNDTVLRPTIRVTMDDDANSVRIVRVSDGVTVASGSRTSMGGIVLTWQRPTDLEEDVEESYRVDASAADDLLFVTHVTVWTGTIRGPAPIKPTIVIRVGEEYVSLEGRKRGFVQVEVIDPYLQVDTVEFNTKEGTADVVGPSAADDVTAGVYTKYVWLDNVHNSLIEPIITLLDGTELRPGAETFDSDDIPEITDVQIAYNQDSATIRLAADSDAAGIHYQPWNYTTSAWGTELTPISGRSGTVTATLSSSRTSLYRSWAVNGNGVSGPYKEFELDRYDPGGVGGSLTSVSLDTPYYEAYPTSLPDYQLVVPISAGEEVASVVIEFGDLQADTYQVNGGGIYTYTLAVTAGTQVLEVLNSVSGGGLSQLFDRRRETGVRIWVTPYSGSGATGTVGLRMSIDAPAPGLANWNAIVTDPAGAVYRGRSLKIGANMTVSADTDGNPKLNFQPIAASATSGTPNFSNKSLLTYSLSGDLTLAGPTNFPDGSTGMIKLTLNGHSLTFSGGAYKWPEGFTDPPIITGATAVIITLANFGGVINAAVTRAQG